MSKTSYKSICILPDPLEYEFYKNLYTMYDLNHAEMKHADCIVVNHDSNADANRIASVTYAIHVLKIPMYIVTHTDVPVPSLWKEDHVIMGDKYQIHEFFTKPERRGRIFVIEGGDGCGKQTQALLLRRRLEQEKYPVKTIDFPNNKRQHGMLIREILAGKFGDIKDIDPYLIASLYAQNRWSVKHILDFWISRGYNIILDRYIISNIAHQGAHEYRNRDYVAKQTELFENKILGLPCANHVIYLDLPPEVARNAMEKDTTRTALDQNELAPLDYKNNVRKIYLEQTNTLYRTYNIVNCMDDKIRISRKDIHTKIYKLWCDSFVNKHM